MNEPPSGQTLRAKQKAATRDEILREYPYLEAEDIAEALAYAA